MQGIVPSKKQGKGKLPRELNKKERMFTGTKQTKMERCSDRVCVQHDFLFFVAGFEVKPM
jgi:hypothetical protein